MPVVYSEAQLAASAAAGDPRLEADFPNADAWHTYQKEWFATVTMGETLPAVGDPNRSRRWKATRRQRGKIEEQREREKHTCEPTGRCEEQKERDKQRKRDLRAAAYEQEQQEKQQAAEQAASTSGRCSRRCTTRPARRSGRTRGS